jgi:hypothetical protein
MAKAERDLCPKPERERGERFNPVSFLTDVSL